ncbi:MAG: peptide chain release factor 1 [Elusimicrobia bacterium]|nr:peptide chain release factor 1 [Elusimicrobiota bacterium]
MNSAYFDDLEKKFVQIEKKIIDPDVIKNKTEYKTCLQEHGFLLPRVQKYRELKRINRHIKELDELISGSAEEEMVSMAEQEKKEFLDRLSGVERALREFESKKNKGSSPGSIILEIRAGAGGEESALFASDLLRMYMRFTEKKGYKTEIISTHSTGLKGLKEVFVSVKGEDAWDNFKYESGTHRVQRVPVTESSGRIHTSTATVAVLPEVDDIHLSIKPEELRIDTFGASGHGGQHLQKTESAVRITHIPTGTVAQCQDDRSQLKNKEKAMRLLRARLYQEKKREQEEKITADRRQQIGGAKRAEKIRTYNFSQNRVTDHRLNHSEYNLTKILDGHIDNFIKLLKTHENDTGNAQ